MLPDCIFCKIINGELPADIILEDDDIIVFQSMENHPLIVPKLHIENVYNLNDNIAAKIMQAAVRVSKAVQQATNCDGINLVQSNGKVAGQDVFHFHMHIKPRWHEDDVVMSWNFEPVDGDLKRKMAHLIRGCL